MGTKRFEWARAGPALQRRSVLLVLAAATVFGLLLLTPLGAYAQEETACKADATTNILGLFDRVRAVGTVILVGAGSLFVLYGGAIYMGSRGSPQAMETGKTAVISALAGVALVLMASLITNIVIDALKDDTVGAGEDCVGTPPSSPVPEDEGRRWGDPFAGPVLVRQAPGVSAYWVPAHVRMPWDDFVPRVEI